jgi:hypothetical protein
MILMITKVLRLSLETTRPKSAQNSTVVNTALSISPIDDTKEPPTPVNQWVNLDKRSRTGPSFSSLLGQGLEKRTAAHRASSAQQQDCPTATMWESLFGSRGTRKEIPWWSNVNSLRSVSRRAAQSLSSLLSRTSTWVPRRRPQTTVP